MRRLSFALAATAVLVAGTSAHAASRPLVLTDPTGDANGVNSQAVGLPLPSTSSSPASASGADLTTVTVTNLFKGKGRAAKPAGITVTLKTAGALQQGVNFVVTMDTSKPCGDSSRVQLGYSNAPVVNSQLAICQSAAAGGTSTTIGSVEADTAKGVITWTLDGSAFSKGTTISNFDASSTVFVVGVFDELHSDAVFRYGV